MHSRRFVITNIGSNLNSHHAGFAVVMVLSVIALLSLLMTSLMTRNSQLLQLSTSTLHQYQGRAYLLGSEAWAQAILLDDLRQSDVDHRNENWAYPVPIMLVEGGNVSGALEDLNGRFNVNNLVQGKEVSPFWVALFKELLRQQNASPDLVWQLVDWLDEDLESHQGGMEDAWYYAKQSPHRSANTAMVDVSEMSMVAGFDVDLVTRLTPLLSALPSGTKVNVNTASETLLEVLGSLWHDETWQVKDMLKTRPWYSLDELPVDANIESPSGIGAEGVYLDQNNMSDYLSLKSHYFRLDAQAQVAEQSTRVLTKFQRTQEIRVLSRIWLPGD